MIPHTEPPLTDSEKKDLGAIYFLDLIPDLDVRIETYRISSESVDEEVAQAFAEQMRLLILGLHEALEGKDVERIRRAAHSLQGMGGTAGVPEISVIGEELSRLAKRGDLERCRELTVRLNLWQGDWNLLSTSGTVSRMRENPLLSGRVLIVDDERPNRLYLRNLLTSHGATVIEADNGSRALELAQQQAPDLALVDVMMPGLSGYEVCQSLVSTPATCHISVIMVTARSTVEDIEHAFILGVFDYIRKPFQPRELLARVHNALQLKRQGDELRKWKARMTRELDAAGALQRKLLPTEPFFSDTSEVRFAYESSMSVGGDLFSAFRLPNGNLCVYVGDVAGHGVGAALVSTLLKVLIEEVARDYFDQGPAVMCNQIHRRFSHYVTNPELYATLFLAIVEPLGRCTAFNCGHPSPLLFDAGGQPLALFDNRGGMPIGLSMHADATPYRAADVVSTLLPAGSLLALFSDGLLEARQSQSSFPCGETILSSLLAKAVSNPDHVDVAHAVMKQLGILGYQLSQDDCTLVVVEQYDPATCSLNRSVALSHQAVEGLATEVYQVLLEKDWSEESARSIQLLAMEHGVNVVDHAGAHPDSRITLHLRLSDRQAFLRFRDLGREWNYQAKLAASQQNAPDSRRGRGLNIIRSIAKHIDRVRYNRENITHYVVSRFFEVSPKNEERGAPHE